MLSIAVLAIGVYLVVRPILRATPRFAEFYADADTFWQKVSAFAYNSSTVALAYALWAIGALTSQLDALTLVLADPQVKQQINNVLGGNPKLLGYAEILIGVLFFRARMRSILRGG
jgi:hypothetical protein